MSGKKILDEVKQKGREILTGEIGALLHDVGKSHPDFVKKQSLEGGKEFEHASIDSFLQPEPVALLKHSKFDFIINSEKSDVYTLITKHHEPKVSSELVKLMKACDGLDSADDKGVVRKKQSVHNTVIGSPFGCPKEKLDISCLQIRLDGLERKLTGRLKEYITGGLSLSEFRKLLRDELQTVFLLALGETRIPANDVTLWAHSNSTASLYKTVLCSMVLGENMVLGEKSDPAKLKWRILGFCWDGLSFIEQGKKVADILARKQIIAQIKQDLKEKFEVEYPLGNAVYEDINGIFFTFPALETDETKAVALAEECAKIGQELIAQISKQELWPFFTLSKARRSLTVLGQELKSVSKRRKIPKRSPVIFIDTEEKLLDIPLEKMLTISDENCAGYDICPVCQIRSKYHKKERCDICQERRKGRLDGWLKGDRERTVWIDEVADVNNRVALLVLSLGLDNWLDGTLIGTIYSQSFEDWLYGKKGSGKDSNYDTLSKYINSLKEKIQTQINKKNKDIETMKNGMQNARDRSKLEARIKEFIKEKMSLEGQREKLEISLEPIKETALWFLERFLEIKETDNKEAAKILDTFYEDFSVSDEEVKNGQDNPFYYKTIWNNFKTKLIVENAQTALTALFTQNPSPARLSRIWREAEEFWDEVVRQLEAPETKGQRIKFNLDLANLKLRQRIENNTPYVFKFKGLEPDNLLVLHTEGGKFFTIESLTKFKLDEVRGVRAVKRALLEKGFSELSPEDEPATNLLILGKDEVGKTEKCETEEYHPFIEVIKTPPSLQVIVPALEAVKILETVSALYEERFTKVTGKLPLNAGLLVANRKFPLYLLLQAGRRMLRDDDLQKQTLMEPWWDITGTRHDKYYGFYPVRKIEQAKKDDDEKNSYYTLDDLAPLAKGRSYALYPGYFDFELLASGEDCAKLAYENSNSADEKKKRIHGDYQLYSRRPYYFYQFKQLVDLWEILKNNLSLSQITLIEETITRKIDELRNVKDPEKEDVLKSYVEAVLRDAFAENWANLSEDSRRFLLRSAASNMLIDTIVLFRHVLKEKEV